MIEAFSMNRLFFALALVSSTACGPVFFVEADFPEVCKTFPNQQFSAAPPGVADLTFPPLNFDFSNQIPSLFNGDRLTGTLNVLSMTLTLKSGAADLSFVDKAHMDLVPPANSSLQPLTVVNYTKDPNAPPPTSINLVDPSQPDVFPFVIGGAFSGSIEVAGSLPQVAWSADIRICVSASGKFQYL
jgi:hypothetical protein